MDLVQIITLYYKWTNSILSSINQVNGVVAGLWITGYISAMIMIAYAFAKWHNSRSQRNEFFETFVFGALALVMFPLGCILVLQALPFVLVGAFFVVTGFAAIKLLPLDKKDK